MELSEKSSLVEQKTELGLVAQRALVSKAIALEDNRAKKTVVQRQTNNTGLPDKLKSGIENLSGHSMDDVKVHYNSSKPAQLNAHAYAQGTEIHVAAGQEKHLPHEAWHVVQQKQGRVKPTKQLKAKININDDAGLEKEADVMGAKALQMKGLRPISSGQNRLCNPSLPFQLVRVGLAEYGLAGKERQQVVEKYHSPEQQIMQRITFGGGNTVMVGGLSIAEYTQKVWNIKFNPSWNGRLQYVVDTNGAFYGEYYPPGINERKNEYHSRFKAGGNVISAGWMYMAGNKVTRVANDSGHYKPGTDGFYKMILILEKLGVNTSKIKKQRADVGSGLKNSTTKEIRETLHPKQIEEIRRQVDQMFQQIRIIEHQPQELPPAVESDAETLERLTQQAREAVTLLEKHPPKIEEVAPILDEALDVLQRAEFLVKKNKPVHKDSFRLAEILLIQAENRTLMK